MRSEKALNLSRSLALHFPTDPIRRFGWNYAHISSMSNVATIWEQMADLVPAGATHVLDLGCGDGGFAKVLRKRKPGVAITAIDLVLENIELAQASCVATGTITVAGVIASTTTAINGLVLTAAGAQGSGDLNFDETAGSDILVASSLVAAINDAGNGLSSVVVADNEGGTSAVVTVSAVTPGTAGNSLTLASSNGTTLAVEDATLTGGIDPADFKVLGVFDALSEETPPWDFVVSNLCVWVYTPRQDAKLLLDLINAKAAKGFALLVYGDNFPHQTGTWFEDARSSSTGLADSYYTEDEGARTTLLESLISNRLRPLWVQRDSTTATAPGVDPDKCLVLSREGDYNHQVARQDFLRAQAAEEAVPTTIKGLAGGTVAPALSYDFTQFPS